MKSQETDFFLILGAFFISPVIKTLKSEIRRDEKKLMNKTLLLGRLELTAKMLKKWW